MQRPSADLLREFLSKKEEGMMDAGTASALKKKLATEFRDQLMFGIPTNEDEAGLRYLSRHLKSKRVVVKLFLRHSLHAKLYLLFRQDHFTPIIGYLGSSNLTLAGLAQQGDLNVDVVEQDAAIKLSKWFEDRWNDNYFLDITDELSRNVEKNCLSPVRRITAHSNAVLLAARHLDKRGGVLIGDVVGLGKTITACALAKVFKETFYLEALVICPKNLVDMWEDYFHKYQIRGKVTSISLLNESSLEERRYRLVVIDESHNLRNRDGKRYGILRDYRERNECKVILLTATPYNKTYFDISNPINYDIKYRKGKELEGEDEG